MEVFDNLPNCSGKGEQLFRQLVLEPSGHLDWHVQDSQSVICSERNFINLADLSDLQRPPSYLEHRLLPDGPDLRDDGGNLRFGLVVPGVEGGFRIELRPA